MFDPNICDTGEVLTVSTSFWLRCAAIPAFLFFLCLVVATLAAPVYVFLTNGNRPGLVSVWIESILLAALWFLPMRLFWYGAQPRELRIYFDEGYYEIQRGFRRFARTTRGRFTDIHHLTLWNKRENRYDISYTTSIVWADRGFINMGRFFTLSVIYNDEEGAVIWANSVAQRLNVRLENRIGK